MAETIIPSSKSNKRVKKSASPPFPPVKGACHFYIPKKNRYCKMVPAKDQRFCGEHIMSETKSEVPSKKLRIPCPLDPSHTCFQTQLQKHLKICNARLEDQPPGFVLNVNAGPKDLPIPDKMTINDLTPEELKKFIDKVIQASDEDESIANYDDRPVDCKQHPALKDELNRTDVSEDGFLKHARQQASILSHMEDADLLSDGNCFVEMGAGRGHVNHWIQRALGKETKSQFILVDRQGVRYKMDSQHREEDDGPKFHRLRMDIQHLTLSEVPIIKSQSCPIVVVSKHLCGAATDLTLRCCIPNDSKDSSSNNGSSDIPDDESASRNNSNSDIQNGSNNNSNNGCIPVEKNQIEVENLTNGKDVSDSISSMEDNISDECTRLLGIVIALCCHHRVDYRSYVGHEYLHSRGFEPREFWLLRSLSSWATCGFDRKKASVEEGEEEKEEEEKGGLGLKEEEENVERKMSNDYAKTNDVGVTFEPQSTIKEIQTKENIQSNNSESQTENISEPNDEPDFKKRWEWYYKMTTEERAAIGRRCKRLLDKGRIQFIQTRRPDDDLKLVKYVDPATSLENVLLLCRGRRKETVS